MNTTFENSFPLPCTNLSPPECPFVAPTIHLNLSGNVSSGKCTAVRNAGRVSVIDLAPNTSSDLDHHYHASVSFKLLMNLCRWRLHAIRSTSSSATIRTVSHFSGFYADFAVNYRSVVNGWRPVIL
ncbi:hypothetical protein L218DRAFT_295901 [Marasmius fiardii PR-910]|nr:hypothetical protein L218DRAFT_295901 [Marasmius fiardii PR-910]